MPKKMDLTGKVFGRWTVLEEASPRNGRRYWHCKCECGEEKDVWGYSLTSGKSESCGCLGKERRAAAHYKNLIGQKFGKLTVLSENKTENGKRYWNCECECGKHIVTNTNQLTSGKTKSCGCLRQEITNYTDITNQTFGYLTALKIIGKNKYNNVIWECQCKCGNKTNVVATQLLKGQTKSCGCLRKENFLLYHAQNRQVKEGNIYGFLKVTGDAGYKQIGDSKKHQSYCTCLKCGKENVIKLDNDLISSKVMSCGCLKSSFGENIISKILINNNIPFEQEKTFSTCRFNDTNALARFDFYIDNQYIIEFDGRQHFKITGGWGTEENFEKTQEHDNFKNQWCKENNIPLIRIPYTHLDDLCLEDLLLETSQFIV